MKARAVGLFQRLAPPRVTHFFARIFRAVAHFFSAFTAMLSVVIDMDGVLVDFEKAFVEAHNCKWPALYVDLDERRHHKLEYDILNKYGLERIAEVLGEELVSEQYNEEKLDNSRERLTRRALRAEALAIINKSGFFSSLPPLTENIEQLKLILDLTAKHRFWCWKSSQIVGVCGVCKRRVGEQRYQVSILTALPNENTAGVAEKTAWLKRHLGIVYFDKLHQRIYVAGQHTDKGDVYWDVIFEDNTRLTGTLRVNSGLHMVVETEHNRDFKPGLFQKFVPRGTDWIKAAGL